MQTGALSISLQALVYKVYMSEAEKQKLLFITIPLQFRYIWTTDNDNDANIDRQF